MVLEGLGVWGSRAGRPSTAELAPIRLAPIGGRALGEDAGFGEMTAGTADRTARRVGGRVRLGQRNVGPGRRHKEPASGTCTEGESQEQPIPEKVAVRDVHRESVEGQGSQGD